jgi:hypothetical protein
VLWSQENVREKLGPYLFSNYLDVIVNAGYKEGEAARALSCCLNFKAVP